VSAVLLANVCCGDEARRSDEVLRASCCDSQCFPCSHISVLTWVSTGPPPPPSPYLSVCAVCGRASLSAALLFGAYLLQQRFQPFLVSTTLSDNLALSQSELEQRLQGRGACCYPATPRATVLPVVGPRTLYGSIHNAKHLQSCTAPAAAAAAVCVGCSTKGAFCGHERQWLLVESLCCRLGVVHACWRHVCV
jgi:hypothetical protein